MADTEQFSAVEAMLREQIERLAKDNNALLARIHQVEADQEYIANHDLLKLLREKDSALRSMRYDMQQVYERVAPYADKEPADD